VPPGIRRMENVSAAVHFCTTMSYFLLRKSKNKARLLELQPVECYFLLSVLCDTAICFSFVQSNTIIIQENSMFLKANVVTTG